MKKINIILYALLVSLLLCACGSSETKPGKAIWVYFLNNSETSIKSEEHYLTSNTAKEQIVEVLTLLGEFPDSKEMKPVISGGINIVNYAYDSENEEVTVSLGAKFLDLSKTTGILSRAAIVKSLTQIEGVSSVILTIEGQPLTDSDGIVIGSMTGEMFLDEDDDQLGNYQKVMIRLYFTGEEGNTLIPIDRSLVHNLDLSNISMEKLVVEQLLSGPASDDSYPTINPETKLLSVTVKDSICYLDFDNAILTPVNNVTSDVVIYSIVNSLIELPGINKVQISIDGRKDIKFRDTYDLTTLFEKNYDLIQ